MMTYQAYGDSAILINAEQKIDLEINASILHLKQTIESSDLPGVTFCIPAYCSLTLGYDPSLIHFEALCNKIKALKIKKTKDPDSRKLNIPVCYEEGFALDLKEVKSQTGLSQSEIINFHTSTLFQVYMIGFLPGFPYLGKVPEVLFCKRKDTPRLIVPARSVGLAGYQTGIYPSQAPGGWQIIGRTPLEIFDASKAHPFLFRAGDQVQFLAISRSDFESIEKNPGTWKIL